MSNSAHFIMELTVLKRIYWLVEGRVLVTEYEGHITQQQLTEAVPAIIHEIETYGQKSGVHLVLDGAKIKSFDREVMNINYANENTARINATGLLLSNPIIFPVPAPMVSMVFSILARIFRPRMILFQTWDATIEYILKTDPSMTGLIETSKNKN